MKDIFQEMTFHPSSDVSLIILGAAKKFNISEDRIKDFALTVETEG